MKTEPINTAPPSADVGTLTVDLGDRAYDIVVGEGLLSDAGRRIAARAPGARAVVVTDENVAGLYLDTLQKSLLDAGIACDPIVLPAGEGTKDFNHLEKLTGMLLDLKAERSTLLVALGGGVIGDLTGFAAAVTLRGLPFVQVPTTLLSQVDSSVGGKTGINTPHGKNLVGAFHQPQLVLADTATLASLPRREILAGYAETLKYALIDDPAFFDWLVGNGAALIDGDAPTRRHAILTGCAAKAAIVAADEREGGQRALLNLGHTFGHALEAEAGYGDKLLHGEGVAIGMLMAFDLSVRMGLCPDEDRKKVIAHYQAVGLPADLKGIVDDGWNAERLIGHMMQDKKVDGASITFILVRGIGKAFITKDVDPADLAATLDAALNQARSS